MGTSRRGSESELAGPDEAERDAEQRENLDHGEADPEERLGDAGRLRLAGGRLDVGGEDQAHADAGSDGREAVTDGGGATHYFGKVHFGFPPVSRMIVMRDDNGPCKGTSG